MKVEESVFKTCDVVLPRRVNPIFPLICIEDGRSKPDKEIMISAYGISWIYFLIFTPERRFSVSIPTASKNESLFRSKRRNAHTRVYLSFFIGVMLVAFFLPDIHPSFDWWLAPITAFLFVLPATLYNFLNPPSFDFTAYSSKVEYEFASEDYAVEFFLLNSQDVISVELTASALKRLFSDR